MHFLLKVQKYISFYRQVPEQTHLHKNVGIDPQNTKKEHTGISLIALNSSLQLRCQGIFVESWNALER